MRLASKRRQTKMSKSKKLSLAGESATLPHPPKEKKKRKNESKKKEKRLYVGTAKNLSDLIHYSIKATIYK